MNGINEINMLQNNEPINLERNIQENNFNRSQNNTIRLIPNSNINQHNRRLSESNIGGNIEEDNE